MSLGQIITAFAIGRNQNRSFTGFFWLQARLEAFPTGAAIRSLILAAFLAFLLPGTGVHAQANPAEGRQKLDRLVELLEDPDIRTWLQNRKSATPSVGAGPSDPAKATSSRIETWEEGIRRRLNALLGALPRIPGELADAAMRVWQSGLSFGSGVIFLVFGALICLGILAGRASRSGLAQPEGTARALVSIGIFTLTAMIVFFAIDWPPLARLTLLAYLLAFICYRIGAVLIALVAPQRLRGRGLVLLALTSFAIATTLIARPLGISPAVTGAMAYLFSMAMLALALEAVWSKSPRSPVQKITLSLFIIAVWLLWCLRLSGLFWMGLYVLFLPGCLRAAGRVATGLSTAEPFSLKNVAIARGARAVVVLMAAIWLAVVWRMTPEGLGHRDPMVTALFYGLLKSVAVVLVADLCWHLARTWIDGKLAMTQASEVLSAADIARLARYRTLLPILRNALAVIIAVMTVLIVLAQMGVEVAPLIAGAGVFGVALGFGSQTLVKDIISGVFYMFDDAFRIGEYIQAKNYKGTVEGFSLRSVRLRHHRGPVFTVPFGELGAVQNMSRDWGVVKFRIAVSHTADVEQIRKLTKKIGTSLEEDAELGPLFIAPLKMKGIEEFVDYGIVLSFGMTLRPSPMQSFIRRKANLLLRQAFIENGIEFAVPSVQVDTEDKAGAAAAATATNLKAQQMKAATAAP